MTAVIAISGRLRAGKTTLAHGLAEALGCPQASFGDYVRAKAREQGLADDRATLQDLGERLIAEEGRPAFCEHTLGLVGAGRDTVPLVVEGVRHADALSTLRELFAPVRVVLVHIETAEQVRRARMQEEVDGEAQLAAVEDHSTEQDSKVLLPGAADVVVSGLAGTEVARDAVVSWLREEKLF
jgi:cytidylate kinase